jgi:hypothetical protein
MGLGSRPRRVLACAVARPSEEPAIVEAVFAFPGMRRAEQRNTHAWSGIGGCALPGYFAVLATTGDAMAIATS